MHQAKMRCLASGGRAASAAKPSAGGNCSQSRCQCRALRLEQTVGRRAGQIVERAARRGLDRPEVQRVGVIAAAVEQVRGEGIEREIECDLEISRQIRAGDLVPVRLKIVDE